MQLKGFLVYTLSAYTAELDQWYTRIIPECGRWNQEGQVFNLTLGYITTLGGGGQPGLHESLPQEKKKEKEKH